jgi:hypothetical protein
MYYLIFSLILNIPQYLLNIVNDKNQASDATACIKALIYPYAKANA